MIGVSYLTPRFKKKWVFGSNMGYSNNSKYLFLHINKYNKDINAIWLSDSRSVALSLRKLGLKSYYRFSLRGLFEAYTAKIFCYNSYASDINIYASFNAIKVNLWHGVGIKNIEFKIKSGPLVKILGGQTFLHKLKHLNFFVKPDFFLSTSPAMTKHFMECFRLKPKNIIINGYPRCELFFWTEEKLTSYINQYESNDSICLLEKVKLSQKTFVYMPTFRDSDSDFFDDVGFDFEKLNLFLKEKNYLFLIKLHTATKINITEISLYPNVVLLENAMDIYPILPFTDILITDYSSIYYDYLLMEDKISILYPFDYDKYISESRDLSMPYLDAVGDNLVYNFSMLLTALNNSEKLKPNKEFSYLRNHFWGDAISYDMFDLVNKINFIIYN